MHRRARPHGLAAGVGIQLACSGGGRYRALEMRYWRRAALADGGATSDRGSHRHQCSEPHVGLRAPGVRPHRITRNTGRAQCVYTADPCNTVTTLSPDRRAVGLRARADKEKSGGRAESPARTAQFARGRDPEPLKSKTRLEGRVCHTGWRPGKSLDVAIE